MTSPDLTVALQRLADFADIRGASMEAAAWRRLAREVEVDGAGVVSQLKEAAKQLQRGDSSYAILEPLLSRALGDGDRAVETAAHALPWVLKRLLEFGTIDSTRAAALAHHGIVTFSDLDAALQDGRIATHLPEAESRLRTAATTLSIDRPQVPLGRATDLSSAFMRVLSTASPEIAHATAAGGIRRFEPLVDSVTIVGVAPDPPSTLDRLTAHPELQSVLHRTNRRAVVAWQQTEVDVRVAAPDEFGTALVTATGSRDHVAALRARGRGLRLCRREEEVYSQSGLPWIAPELRLGRGEIEAAASGGLPSLIGRQHIRGDLHMHTTYSDGGDDLATMIGTCAALGYEYIAVTDHSERSAASRTLTLADLARQRDEIRRQRERFPAMTILHGVEVDIMPDGTLDFPDAVLSTLDIVLASLHDRAGQGGARLTERCLSAIAHPLVNIITHPANRMVGRDAGHDLDFPAVYAAAAATGTALEIDGAPSHLDLDGEHAREAVQAGATVVIDSDCHRARLLDKQMRMGIGTARRGWVEPGHVLNARPLEAVLAFISAKRRIVR